MRPMPCASAKGCVLRCNWITSACAWARTTGSGVLAAEVGMQAKVTDGCGSGRMCTTPTRALLGGPYDERIPTLLRVGMGYTFSRNC
ncbi:MAG: hypothetical protein IPO56_14700 [Flavobacteriales bacterium]|nr:hypothetical protein [Flavobacteriales bacterium]